MCQLIHIPMGYIRQPRVISEVVAGIILGPSVMGRIPNFTATCFPTASRPLLNLMANFGVIMFLFLVGLEVDLDFIKKNYRIALSVGLVNMAIPFGLGCAIAVGLYNQYEPDIKFTTFMVFIAVAMCVTAFPVLARILTELRLLKDRVGTIVLSAGITNDLVGWMLLALSVTLANSGSGIDTLYILLVTIGWTLFVIFPVRWVYQHWILRRDIKSGSLSRLSILITLVLVFISSFFTDIIGVHPIFGAFLIGVIVPRQQGFTVDMTNKIEDLVEIVLIPIYFAIAGFNVNLESLNSGIDWAYIIAIIVIAVVGKVFGGFISAKFNGLFWKESLAVGVLMSCKGIVEIVVLTVGLNANIITEKLFSMFVVMTLVSTFLTTPLTLWIYPVSYREKVQRYIKGEIDWEGNVLERSTSVTTDLTQLAKGFTKVLYNIEKIDDYMNLLNLLDLFYNSSIPPPHSKEGSDIAPTDRLERQLTHDETPQTPFNVIFLKRLTERTSDLIDASTSSLEEQTSLQLEILSKIFEFMDIPHQGRVKYFIEPEDRLEAFRECSTHVEDLLIYSVETIPETTEDISNIAQPIAFFKNTTSRKFTEITISFDSETVVNIVETLILNRDKTHNVKLRIKILVLANGADETVEAGTEYVRTWEAGHHDVTYIHTSAEISGLFIASLRNPIIEEVDKQDGAVLAVK